MEKKLKVSPSLQEALREFQKTFDEWSRKNEDEFQKTLETIRGIFNQKGFIIPRDWQEVYFDWYLENNAEELDKVPFEKFHELMKDRKIIFEWAIHYTKKIELDFKEGEAEKLENLPHQLCVLDFLGIIDLIENKFLNTNYSGKSREGDKAKLIASILGQENRVSTIRLALKNKDYLSTVAKEKAILTLRNISLDKVIK
jgi:hypothetical protein